VRFGVGETRKIAAILVADVVGYSRLAGADEDRTLARLRALRGDLIDPTIALHHGRTVKLTGDGALVEFRSVVDAVRCAVEIQRGMIARNSDMPLEQRIEFRIGIHLGDVVEETDGDLMGDAVNIAAQLEAVAAPCAICLSEDAYRQVSGRLDMEVTDLGPTQLKNIERSIRIYSLQVGVPAQAKPVAALGPSAPKTRSSLAPLVAGVAALLIVLSGGAWWLLGAYRLTAVPTKAPTPIASNSTTPAEPRHLSVVVLPFANLSNDPSQDYLADGLTENLTTDLSRLSGSFVIARNTAFTFKMRPWPSLRERPMPLSLTDDEFAAVQAVAAPIHPLQRDAFLKALAVELERHPVVGPGLVHRCAAALQKTFVVAAHSEPSHSAEPAKKRA
jgi:adenylate cyclase